MEWHRCSLGQNINDNCSGKATVFYSVNSAMKACEKSNLGGKKWKLPSYKDFIFITKKDELPMINHEIFPNTQMHYVVYHPYSDTERHRKYIEERYHYSKQKMIKKLREYDDVSKNIISNYSFVTAKSMIITDNRIVENSVRCFRYLDN